LERCRKCSSTNVSKCCNWNQFSYNSVHITTPKQVKMEMREKLFYLRRLS
jgi:hypothetical protein